MGKLMDDDGVVHFFDRAAEGGKRDGAGHVDRIHFKAIDPAAWMDMQPPARRWIVEGLIPSGYVTMLNGDGGVGKSLLALQLLYACASGKTWCGRRVEQCRGFGMFCEDDEDEIHRRTYDIARGLSMSGADLAGNVRITSRVGMPNALMEYDDAWSGSGGETDLYRRLWKEAEAFGARLIVIDGLQDVFAGNENARPQARGFIQSLGTIARELDGAVVILAHPSRSGMASGSGDSGNTGWNNTVRSRLYLTKPKDEAGGDKSVRELSSMKANYSGAGGAIRLRWVEGMFVCDEPEGGEMFGAVSQMALDQAVLQAAVYLVDRGTLMPASPMRTGSFVASVRSVPACKRYGFGEVTTAQDRLLASGKLVTVEMGPPSRRRVYIRPSHMRLPGEGE